jgi:hypothetical protein
MQYVLFALSKKIARCSPAEKFGGDCLEASIRLIECGVQPGHRKIAGEHRPLRPEAGNTVQDDLS